jgi:hypothetical protein
LLAGTALATGHHVAHHPASQPVYATAIAIMLRTWHNAISSSTNKAGIK